MSVFGTLVWWRFIPVASRMSQIVVVAMDTEHNMLRNPCK